MAPQPGWYADADSAEQLRYWDGEAWTERTAPREAPKKRRAVPLPFAVGGAVAVLILGVLLGAAGGGASDPTESDEYIALQADHDESVAEAAKLERDLGASERELSAIEGEVEELVAAAADAETGFAARDTALQARETDVQTRETAVADRETAVSQRESTSRSSSNSAAGSSTGGASAQQPAAQPQQPAAPAPSTYYKNCTAAREAGAAPVRAGQPGYGSHLDRDGDGVGCE